mmetsp:Transcript_38956/g.77344  ORF Transcript_38956/g.77344 Transcript_38956/m.77344 type:complete len:113 (-) Transcript_38956:255-593(-)
MAVVSEVESVYIPSHGQHVNALMRDVAFSRVDCKLCKGTVKPGSFAIVLPRCKDCFHYECFMEALRPKSQPNPQEAGSSETEGAVEAVKLPPLLCPHCFSSLTEGRIQRQTR